jgi:hypothetical protein
MKWSPLPGRRSLTNLNPAGIGVFFANFQVFRFLGSNVEDSETPFPFATTISIPLTLLTATSLNARTWSSLGIVALPNLYRSSRIKSASSIYKKSGLIIFPSSN